MHFFKIIYSTLIILPIIGCGNMLPKTQTQSTYFSSFEEAKNAVNSLVPMKSNLQSMIDVGIDPYTHPNINILSYSTILNKLAINSNQTLLKVDEGILLCIQSEKTCKGFEITELNIKTTRSGNFFSDILNFRRNTRTTGWSFNAIILLINDTVIYRSWGGQSHINELNVKINPMGFLVP
jgi:hypothetical protein